MVRLAPWALALLLLPAIGRAQRAEPDAAPPVEDESAPAEEGAEPAEAEPAEAEPAEGDLAAAQASMEGEQREAQHDAAAAPEEVAYDERRDHEFQLGVRVGIGVPFLFVLRYGSGPPCARNSDGTLSANTFCPSVGSAIMDFDSSFGVARGLEITTMLRVGLLADGPTLQNAYTIGLGIRTYLDPQSIPKLYLGVRAILNITPNGSTPIATWHDVDGGVRGEVGLQVDALRWLGFYLQGGVSVLFANGLAGSVDITGGAQGRLP